MRKFDRCVRQPEGFCEEWGKPILASQRWVAELVEVAGGEFVGEPGKSLTRKKWRRSSRTFFSHHGAAPATGFRWRKLSSNAIGSSLRGKTAAGLLH